MKKKLKKLALILSIIITLIIMWFHRNDNPMILNDWVLMLALEFELQLLITKEK